MGHKIRDLSVASFTLILAIFSFAQGWAAETAGQKLAKLEKLSPSQREKALIKGAKAEGEMTIYSSMRQDQLASFTKAFHQRYPFLKVNALRITSQRQVTKVQTEVKTKRYTVDVINGLTAESYDLKEIGALDPIKSPNRMFFSETKRDKEGYFVPLYIIPVVLGYNPNQIKRSEVPKSYKDLLDPKWEGKMFLDTDDYEWFIVLLKRLGRAKGLKYMKNLAKMSLSMQRGRTLQTQLVMVGERPMAIALHAHSVLGFKKKGAPIDWTILDPYFAKANYIMLARYAPHPYAAGLFIDWALSQEGQSKITSFGRVVARRGIPQRFPELMKKNFMLAGTTVIGPVLRKSLDEFKSIFVDGR